MAMSVADGTTAAHILPGHTKLCDLCSETYGDTGGIIWTCCWDILLKYIF